MVRMDLLCDEDEKELKMPTEFDDFTEKASVDYKDRTYALT